MKGKADMLLANRYLSALVVVSLVMSAFAGILFLADSRTEAQAVGDLIVTGGVYTIENIEQKVDGNVEVRDGGELVIRDGTLSIISNYDPAQRHSITVGVNGKLTLEHGVITTHLDQIDPWPFLVLTVTDGGELVATEGSLLQFPGNIVLGLNAKVSLFDSTVTALPEDEVAQYVVGSSGAITFDSADDGPAIGLFDATLELFETVIDRMPEYPTDAVAASNLTLGGSSVLLAVNSYIGVDFGPALSIADWYTHNMIVLSDLSHAYTYGSSFEPFTGNLADRAQAISASGFGSSPAIPLTIGAGDTTVGQSVTSLSAIDGNTYQVDAQQTMEIETWDVAGLLDALVVSSATLVVTYSPASNYQGNRAVEWAAEGGSYAVTGIVPDETDPVGTTGMFTLPLASLPTVGDLRNMDLRFVNNGGAGTGYVDFDRAWIMFTVGADAYVYRWLNLTIGDEYGVPVPGATITATFTGGTELEGQEAVYFTPTGVSVSPPSEILDYMGETALSFRVTKSDGIAAIPYLTDVVTDSGGVTSQFVGSYALTGSALIESVTYESTESYSFPAYPAMESSDQSFNFAVELIGVSASSPDPARWLVVPLESSDELTIEDMTYYHAGDIIVAAGGTLTLRDAVLQLVQSEPYERTIYVDGSASDNGTFLVEDSMITSDLPMNLIVQGYGTFILRNSVIHGVNIIAKENAQVIMLDNSSMDGMLSTTWDSSAQVILRDTSLVQTPHLAGNSVGGFTNSSLPSISVEDSAVANIYRWIHVTVFDGASFPLPNATVTIRYFVNETFAGSAVSSYLPGQLGVAKVNSLGTRLIASGSTFIGNYRVNVSYSFGGTDYYGDEIAVGVMPYSEPLEKNATYAVVTIEEALSDLSVGEITTAPLNPVKGEATTVNARINNDGIVGAYYVTVDFYDDDDNEAGVPTQDEWFATVVVPWICPDNFSIASATWLADYDLDPYSHRLVAIVDANNTIPELGEPPVVTQMGEGYITVQSLADLEVRSGTSEIWASSSIVIVNTPVQLNANIHNIGDAVAAPVLVNFYDSTTLIGFVNVSVNPGEYTTAFITHTFTTAVSHTLWVRANENMAITELSYGNNNNTVTIVVRPPPDLNLRDMTTTPTGAVSGGNPLNVTAMLENLQLAPIANPVVKLYANYTDQGSSYSLEYSKTIPTTLALGDSPVEVWFLFTVPILSETSTMDLTMIVNHARTQTEASYANNMQTLQVLVLDIRPDLAISGSDIRVYRGTGEVQSETFGRTLTIVAEVMNLGGRDANTSVMIGVRTTGYNHTILTAANYFDVNASSSTNATVSWTVGLTTPGQYELWVWVDSPGDISEPDDSNNFAARNFTINQLQVTVTVTPDKAEHDAGDLMVVAVQVVYAGTGDPVQSLPNVTCVLWLGEDVITLSRSNATTTDSTGIANAFIRIPADLDSGQYTVMAEILGATYESDTTVHISAQVAGGLFPWWVWVLIIVAVVGVVAGFTVYTYVYGLGKLVECGECGAFIPAASKRCPKCGVEFEAGTMKCSECGAWIPAESTECPNCGVKFVGETEEEADYLERMKKEYDEMVSKYRELAKPELGKKFSEKQFEEWWKKQPAYISFDDWLAKEEEKKKEGPVPCPVCGTLNPKEATVCHKCGTVFAAAKAVPPGERKGPPPAAPPSVERPVEAAQPSEQAPPAAAPVAAAPRMVIRRPIEKKVVPKKIIKTPLGGEEKEGEGNEEQ